MSASDLFKFDSSLSQELLDESRIRYRVCLFPSISESLQGVSHQHADKVFLDPFEDLSSFLQLNHFIGIAVSKIDLPSFKVPQVNVLQSQQRIIFIDDFVRALPHLKVQLAEKGILNLAKVHFLSILGECFLLSCYLAKQGVNVLWLHGGSRPKLH